jgi:hypothetical protein
MNIKYYLIHGIDKERGPRMISEFKKWGLDNENIKWMLTPNKDEITNEIREKLLIKSSSFSCGNQIFPGCPNIKNGQISCTYKHYLCIKDIVENRYDYGVIMEDNLFFCDNIPNNVSKYINQLNSLYPNWDILFDTKWKSIRDVNEIEQDKINNEIIVYPKSNEITEYCHGGTRLAQFYIVTNNCAKKLYENYIPFNNAPDWWMNDLFRKLHIKSFWSEPSISDVYPHISTAN